MGYSGNVIAQWLRRNDFEWKKITCRKIRISKFLTMKHSIIYGYISFKKYKMWKSGLARVQPHSKGCLWRKTERNKTVEGYIIDIICNYLFSQKTGWGKMTKCSWHFILGDGYMVVCWVTLCMFMQNVKLAKFWKLQKIRRGEGKDWGREKGRMGGKERDRGRQR